MKIEDIAIIISALILIGTIVKITIRSWKSDTYNVTELYRDEE